MTKAAIARAGIGATIATAETVARAEADLTQGFVFLDDGDDAEPSAQGGADHDLFDGIIAVGTSTPSTPTSMPSSEVAPPTASLPRPDDDFEID